MGQRRHCLAETSVILFLTLLGHVTQAFILLAPPGTTTGENTNFTLMDIGIDEDFSLTPDDLYQIFTHSKNVDRFPSDDNEITTLDHDTQRPTHEKPRQRWEHSHQDGRLHHSPQRHGAKVNIDAGKTPEPEPGTQIWKGWEYRDDEGRVPFRFQEEEVKMPEPLLPPRRASRPRKGHRVKRRARASVVVRAPASRSFQSGIQSYIRTPRRSRVDARVGVLVVADYSVYRQYMEANGNNHPVAVARIRRYYGMVFAMMNERFQTINDPYLSITVTISGILIAQKRTDSPWTEKIVNWANKKYHGRASVDTATSLHDFSQWLEGRDGLPEFDHAMVFTAYRLTDPHGAGLGGMAYLEAVCDTKSGNAVSIVGDKGDFQSVRVATHELAHSLGATHDGESGAESCPSRDAFIMSSMTSHNQHAPLTNAFHFSHCSIRAMARHLSKSRSSCVTNKPPVYYHYDLGRHPPGRIYNADLQCKLIFGTKSMFCGDGTLASVICGQLWCRDPNRDNGCRTNSYLTALPGTPCDKHGVCSKGVCVLDKTRYDGNNNNNRISNNRDKNSSGVSSTSRIGKSKSSIAARGGDRSSSNNNIIRINSNSDRNRNIDINRGKPINTIRGSNINTKIDRNINTQPNSNSNRDRNINNIRGSSNINRDINVSRDRNLDVSRGRKISKNTDRDTRRQNSYTRDRNTNRDSLVKDNRYLRNSSISRVKVTSRDRDTNRQNSHVRGRNSNRDIIVSKDDSRNRARISTKTNDNTNSIRNVQPRQRINSIPNSQKAARPSYRMRKLRRKRRHRARQRSRSGSRRAGRKHRKRGKRKHRCKGDKNENYCQGLIELNPGGCRRKAIRQYCCATCRRKRRAKNRVR